MAAPTNQNYYDVSRWMYGNPDNNVLPPDPANLDPFYYAPNNTFDSGLLASGFHGAAFVTEGADPHLVIGFEGTDLAGIDTRPLFALAQVEADISLYFNSVPQALKDAITFTQEVLAAAATANIPVANITVTGHSLGAAIASYVAAQLSLGGTTFASPGIPSTAIPDNAVSALTNYVEIGDPIGNYSGTPVNYEGPFLYNEGISRFGDATYIGSLIDIIGEDVLRDALGEAGAQFGPGKSIEDKAIGLAAFGKLAATYHPLTVYGGDLDLDTGGTDTSVGNLTAKEASVLFGDILDQSRLVNDAYYAVINPDVRKAGMDADAHYAQYGWQEGRDPNAYFSTTGYLAANSDVRAAGINPLTHFDNGGWKEGRDPSASFDVELYLLNNPDVKAAGVDPLAHYLNGGNNEGRVAYAAIGQSGSIGAGNAASSFDPEYYLLSNPDVAKAAITAGGDAFAFAASHYQTFGWHEGRDPNAYFDTKGYLAAYADVKAAGVNPLTHFDNGGWREGRDASAKFDTAGYLAENPDVAAAGVDPLRHFIAGGADEGRLAVNDGQFG